VQITWGPACGTVSRYSTRADLSSSLIGVIRPDFPLLAESFRQMVRPISPWESLVIPHSIGVPEGVAVHVIEHRARHRARAAQGGYQHHHIG
jgi:hypothetical protein